MSYLTEDWSPVDIYERKKVASLPETLLQEADAEDDDDENSSKHPKLELFKWSRDGTIGYRSYDSETEVTGEIDWDVGILFCPNDGHTKLPRLRHLLEVFQIPTCFAAERRSGVTHSFGLRQHHGADRRQTTFCWAHFLAPNPSGVSKVQWAKFACLLRWESETPAGSGLAAGGPQIHHHITMLNFGSRRGSSLDRLVYNAAFSAGRDDILQDPFLLLDMAFEAWIGRLDKKSWKLVQQVRGMEDTIFAETGQFDRVFHGLTSQRLFEIHWVSKSLIYTVEGLDSCQHSLDAAISRHDELFPPNCRVHSATRDALLYRRERLNSTRLRVRSAEQAAKNLINLAFNVNSMQGNRAMQRDSYTMKILSLMAMVFLPISAVSSMFATPFFTTVNPNADGESNQDAARGAGGGGAGGSYLRVNKQLWILFAITVPVTLSLFIGWFSWMRYKSKSRLGLKRQGDAIGAKEKEDVV